MFTEALSEEQKKELKYDGTSTHCEEEKAWVQAATLAGAVGNTEHLDEDMHQDPVST